MAQEDFDTKFRAAWLVLSRTCASSIAPEATYQAWFAHYLISQFGIDRVAREPIFKYTGFESTYRGRFTGGEIKLDAVVTRTPGIVLPHYIYRGTEGSGVETLQELAIISELKVSSTQGGGLDHTEVSRDFWKLSLLLHEAERRGYSVPLAYVCVLDNHPRRRYNVNHPTGSRLVKDPHDPRVNLLHYSAHDADQVEGLHK